MDNLLFPIKVTYMTDFTYLCQSCGSAEPIHQAKDNPYQHNDRYHYQKGRQDGGFADCGAIHACMAG